MRRFHREPVSAVFVLVSLCWQSALLGEPVGPAQARRAADAFLTTRTVPSRRGAGTVSAAGQETLAGAGWAPGNLRELRDDNGTVLAHIADLEPGGFIALSADTGIPALVAYSLASAFPSGGDTNNPLYRMLRGDMKLRMKALAENPDLAAANAGKLWDLYMSGQAQDADGQPVRQWPGQGATPTGGWLETAWDQGPPYNSLCPLDPVDGNRSYVGCVATALAQLVHYHRRFSMRFGEEDSYTAYSGMRIDGDSALYDFPSFPVLNDYLDALRSKYAQGLDLNGADIAALSLACGLAVQMDYSSEGSGASFLDVPTVLVDRLGFHSARRHSGISRDAYLALQGNLTNGLPALVGISPPDGWGGHVIVCDGYNTHGEYHLNFGWGIPYPAQITEAWYCLPSDMPSRASVISDVILNIRPDAPVLDADRAFMDFYGAPQQETEPQSLHLTPHADSVWIDSISSPDGFVISTSRDGYSDSIGAFEMGQQDSATIHVRFCPQRAGGFYGPLTIRYNDGNVVHVILKGWSFEGGTDVPAGEVLGVWSEAQSPYFVSGDIAVPPDGTLTVKPGVKVYFMGPYSLTVGKSARLLANGDAARPVELTAWNREAGWGGLRFIESSTDDVLRHCSISFANKGAGSSSPADKKDTHGGAIYCAASSPRIEHCRIVNNMGDMGGAIYCNQGAPAIINTLIANNTSLGGRGRCGGVYFYGRSPAVITGGTIVNNAPGGIFAMSYPEIPVVNTIVWGNDKYQIDTMQGEVAVTFSVVEGGYEGQGNMDLDPCFLDPAGTGGVDPDALIARWELHDYSPCIDAGTSVSGLPGTDLSGAPRIHGDAIDIGAFESRTDGPVMTILPSVTVDAGFVQVDATGTAQFELANTGDADFSVGRVDVSDSSGVFILRTPVEGRTLAPGGFIRMDVEFTPTQEAVYTAAIDIRSTGDGGLLTGRNVLHKRIALRGAGVSGTVVPAGPVSGTWTKAASPYSVTGDVAVPRGGTLTIEPGVVVRFAGHFGLTVPYKATLRAAGTAQDKILFTATDPYGGWFGIRFYSSGTDDILKHCIFEYAYKPRHGAWDVPDLYGGAIFCGTFGEEWVAYYTYSSPLIDSCLFRYNQALTGGAVACLDGSLAKITNNTLVDNYADYDGGAISLYAADCTVANNVIAHNYALAGGGIMNYLGAPTITNNTIVANRPSAMHLDTTTMPPWPPMGSVIRNNILWENEIFMEESVAAGEYDIRFNCIQGGWVGEGNIDADPRFADPGKRDYHLKSQGGRWDLVSETWVVDAVTSPCLDAGAPGSAVGDEPQPNGSRINMGAYGGTDKASKSTSQ